MPNIEFTDEALRNAAILVRESMLSSLNEEKVPEHEFPDDFLKSVREEARQSEKKHRHDGELLRRCIAAVLSVVVGVTLFFAINTEARAAAAEWIKKVFGGQTLFSFLQEDTHVPLDFQLLWLPDGVEMVDETQTELTHSQLYQDAQDSKNGFVIRCGSMDSQGDLMIVHGDASYDIRTVEVNGLPGELYISNDTSISNVLVWFDEPNRIVFTIDSTLTPNVILHIAENVKLDKSPK